MYFLYSLLLTLAFIVLLPRFVFDAIFKGKYAAGFKQRLGFVPALRPDDRKVVWLHCVSVGEANAARTLAARLKEEFPEIRLVVSTTTRTGQELAKTLFGDIAELVFYFPFDWAWAVRRSLRRLSPSIALLMETELWFNFVREASRQNTAIAIVNGRLSERSYKRYSYAGRLVRRVLGHVDIALMQGNSDASHLMGLGMRPSKIKVTGNLKFDHEVNTQETDLTDLFRLRFSISNDAPLIVAASTHSPEEEYLLEAFRELWKNSSARLPRLMIAPRHPERFADVAGVIEASGFSWTRRSASPTGKDATAEIILLDSIGELRAAYPLAEAVFVGGSLIEHGGQSIFEPAAAGKAIITGPHTRNFDAAISEFLSKNAIIQLPDVNEIKIVSILSEELGKLLTDEKGSKLLGTNALAVMEQNQGAVERTLDYLSPLLK